MEYALEVSGMYKRFDTFELTNINLKLEPGYIMGLIGPNGAGKSTLIQTMLGLFQPTEGSIKIFGYDLWQQERKAKAQVGFVLDENPFFLTLSARENAHIYGRYYPEWDQKTFEMYCKVFDLNIKKPLKKLSKGNQMKFQLAFALSHNAKLLVFDEPTAGLDPVFRRELLEIMCDVISEGDRSILFSTHLTEELDKLADYLTFIYRGKLLFSASKEKLLEQYGLVRASAKELGNLDRRFVVGSRINDNASEALVLKQKLEIPVNLTIVPPTIEEIMYYTLNGTEN
jgi:ABC-2 type transport system ATP-binding protein